MSGISEVDSAKADDGERDLFGEYPPSPEHEAVLRALDPRMVRDQRILELAALSFRHQRELDDIDLELELLAPMGPKREPGGDDGDDGDAPKTRWGFASAKDFLAREYPPQQMLYLDIVPANEVTVLMAAPNAGKTFLALEIVCAVAASAASRGIRAALVEEEGNASALQVRLRRALAASNAPAESVAVAWNTRRSLLDRQDRAELVRDCAGAQLIVLDSLAALTAGLDENDSAGQSLVATSLHEIKTDARAAVFALHHMSKEAWREGEVPTLRHLRGHSALAGRVDNVLALTPMESDRDSVKFMLYVVKSRDNTKSPPRLCTVSMVGEKACFSAEAVGTAPASASEGYSRIRADVISAVANAGAAGVSKRALEDQVHGRGALIRAATDELLAAGILVRNPQLRFVVGR